MGAAGVDVNQMGKAEFEPQSSADWKLHLGFATLKAQDLKA